MGAVGGFFLGGGFLSSPLSYPSSYSAYNHVKINGEGTIDKLRVLNTELSESELDALTLEDEYTWDVNTLLYAEFSNNTSGGTIYLADPITSWTVVRTTTGVITPKTIYTDLPVNTRNVSDYSTVKGEEYYYRIYPITANYVLSPIVTNTVEVDYCKVILIDEVTGESYLFNLNLDLGNIETIQGRNKYDTGYYLYPAISIDGRRYREGSITCLMGYVSNGVYIDTVSYLNDLELFITNGNNKYIKDMKGFVLKVNTFGFNHKIDETFYENPTRVTFNFTEVAEV